MPTSTAFSTSQCTASGTARDAVSSDIACTMDWFVTALQLVGAEVPGDRAIDGVPLIPML